MLGLLVSGSVALWIALLFTPFLIRYFRTRELGQHIREDGPASHSAKAGTPTMGGIGIVAAVIIGYLTAHAIPFSEVTAGIIIKESTSQGSAYGLGVVALWAVGALLLGALALQLRDA